MSNEDDSVWLTYNGEIYNFRQLREQLEGLGHYFKTHCDTEVIIHAYEQWGNDCVKHLRGMFAFCIVDLKKRCFLLARDPFGIKPLCYRVGAGYIAFASELSALRAVQDAVPLGNAQAVDYFLRFQYIPAPYTIYDNVFKLPPATLLSGSLDGKIEETQEYQDINFSPEPEHGSSYWESEADSVWSESVNAHLISDVHFGVFLSGGLDSTLVALKMSQLVDGPLHAFTLDFPYADYSEAKYARQAAARCGVTLHTATMGDDAISILPQLIEHYGEPFGDSSALPTWYVARLARDHVPMVLSGDGGDENFGGYSTYLTWMELDALERARRLSFSHPKKALGSLLLHGRRVVKGETTLLDNWQQHMMYVKEQARRSLWRDEFHTVLSEPCFPFVTADERARKGRFDRLAYAQYLDFRTYLPGAVLTKVDVASMYHGLEVRTPLLDNKVNAFAVRLPLEQRVRRKPDGSLVSKSLMKAVLRRDFNDDFVNRPKQGFAVPRALWFLKDHPNRPYLENLLVGKNSPLCRLFRPETIKLELAKHTGSCDNSNTLWLLTVLSLWLGQNPDVVFEGET